MKIKTGAFAIFALMMAISVQGQEDKTNSKSSVGLALGATINYYYGPGDRNFGDYESERVNWQANGMLGISLSTDKSGRRTMLAGFGALGFNNASTLSKILADQNYLTTSTRQRNSNNFYQLEGGLLIAEMFRISTGVGQQNFDNQNLVNSNGTVMLNQKSLQYNSTTVGFNINVTNVAIAINCNFMSGKDFYKTVITPSAGLMIKL